MDREDAGEKDKHLRIPAHVGCGIMECTEVQSRVGATRDCGGDERGMRRLCVDQYLKLMFRCSVVQRDGHT